MAKEVEIDGMTLERGTTRKWGRRVGYYSKPGVDKKFVYEKGNDRSRETAIEKAKRLEPSS